MGDRRQSQPGHLGLRSGCHPAPTSLVHGLAAHPTLPDLSIFSTRSRSDCWNRAATVGALYRRVLVLLLLTRLLCRATTWAWPKKRLATTLGRWEGLGRRKVAGMVQLFWPLFPAWPLPFCPALSELHPLFGGGFLGWGCTKTTHVPGSPMLEGVKAQRTPWSWRHPVLLVPLRFTSHGGTRLGRTKRCVWKGAILARGHRSTAEPGPGRALPWSCC